MAVHAPWRVGTLTQGAVVADPASAPTAYTSTRVYSVDVDGLPASTCELARREPTGTEVGTVIFVSAADGGLFPGGTPEIEQWMADLAAAGWRIVQCRWPSGWHTSSAGGKHGPTLLAGRVASVIRYVRNTWATSGNLILCGGSGGASQMAYALSFYDVGPLVSKAVMIGGPVHSSLNDLCLAVGGLGGDITQRAQIDDPYDLNGAAGPCELQSATTRPSLWFWDSILRGNLTWPPTVFVWGADDTTPGPGHGGLVYAKQLPSRSVRRWPHGTPHNGLSTAKGRAVVESAFWNRPAIRQSNVGLSTTGLSLAGPLIKAPVKPGNLLAYVHRATTGQANMSAPAGCVVANAGGTDAIASPGTAGLKIYWRIATGGEESGLSAGTTTSVLQALDVYEVEHPDGGIWTPDRVTVIASTPATLTLTLGPTGVPTVAKSWCLAAVGTTGGYGSLTSWTGGYVSQAEATTRRLLTAARALHAAAAQGPVCTWGSSTTAAGLIVVFRT